MSKKRRLETDQSRSERLEQEALTGMENSAAEERALDAAVRRSIKLHGP
jgi:hypothetical protein